MAFSSIFHVTHTDILGGDYDIMYHNSSVALHCSSHKGFGGRCIRVQFCAPAGALNRAYHNYRRLIGSGGLNQPHSSGSTYAKIYTNNLNSSYRILTLGYRVSGSPGETLGPDPLHIFSPTENSISLTSKTVRVTSVNIVQHQPTNLAHDFVLVRLIAPVLYIVRPGEFVYLSLLDHHLAALFPWGWTRVFRFLKRIVC